MPKKAHLEGHQFDLDHLTQLFPSGDVTVVHEDDRYYLTASEIDNPPPGTKFHEVAERLIGHVNGLGRTTHSDFRPVRLSGIYDDETGTIVVAGTAALEVRATLSATVTVVDANGNVKPPDPPRGPDYMAVAAKNPDVAEALEIMGQDETPNWDDLYKMFEIVREAIKPDTIVSLGWATRSELNSFKESACHPYVSGKDARHARRPGQPQHQQMSPAQGRQFIRELIGSSPWSGDVLGR
jgi:hypothetical protein